MNEENRVTGRRHSISGAFVFALLGVFAVFATFVVLLGAQFYRNVVEQTDLNNEQRILTNYVINVVRGNDAANSVEVKTIGDTEVLAFVWNAGDASYETLIYYHDGYLREYFGIIDAGFELSYGEIICPAMGFEPDLNDQVICADITGESGRVYTMHLALRCEQEVAE